MENLTPLPRQEHNVWMLFLLVTAEFPKHRVPVELHHRRVVHGYFDVADTARARIVHYIRNCQLNDRRFSKLILKTPIVRRWSGRSFSFERRSA